MGIINEMDKNVFGSATYNMNLLKREQNMKEVILIPKVIKASVDTICITMLVESMEEAIKLFVENSKHFPVRIESDKVFVDWTDNYSEQVIFEDVTNRRGIIHYEHH